MKIFKQYINTLVITAGILFLSGCTGSNVFSSTANAIVSPSTDLVFDVAKDINPDLYERPSPVVVTIYELSSRTIFDNQDFFALYEDSESILGPDLLNKEELELQPEQKLTHTLELNKNARFVGIVVAYRDIDKSRWRGVVEVSPTGYDDIDINVEKLAVYIKE
ncbi:type VI secretion system lipoprotein TssJ [Psychromonas aquimarina]|uniref:type VI secretion system lipoprotein TssJ n=1 Tax=Psychromonas aquimarina TaxID=444919 RepID=UPI000428E042|nr:type VI secretion system lipoprotein TssJ [Psychromonas aquimarina]